MLSITSWPVSNIASTVKITIEEHVTVTNRDLVNHNQVEINMVRPIFILCQQTIFTRIGHLRPRIIKLCLLKLYTPDNTSLFEKLQWCSVQLDQDVLLKKFGNFLRNWVFDLPWAKKMLELVLLEPWSGKWPFYSASPFWIHHYPCQCWVIGFCTCNFQI